MKHVKNHLNFDELQDICSKLGISTDGLKSELIERILNFIPKKKCVTVSTSSQSTDSSQLSIQRIKIVPKQTSDQAIQTSNDALITNSSYRFNFWYYCLFFMFLIMFIIGFFGGCFSLFGSIFFEEKIEVPVKHSFGNMSIKIEILVQFEVFQKKRQKK